MDASMLLFFAMGCNRFRNMACMLTNAMRAKTFLRSFLSSLKPGVCFYVMMGCAFYGPEIQEARAQTNQYKFERLGMREGLSHHNVNDLYKDSTGFIWIATSSGLNRFDGHSTKVFRNIPGDTSSLLVDDIQKIFPGPQGKIWLYTHAGNIVYDPRTEKFERTTDAFLKSISIFPGLITSISKDKQGNFWFIHYNSGLFRYSPKDNQTIRFEHRAADQSSISSMSMSGIEQDRNGDYWVVHQNGIFEKLDHKTLKVTYRNDELMRRFGGELFEYVLMIDSDNELWLYNDRNYGCFRFNPSNGSIVTYNTSAPIRLNSNIVRGIVEGDDSVIWIATDHGGLNLLDKKTNQIQYLLHSDDDDHSLPQSSINTIFRDDEGIIWLGTYRNGVCYYHRNIFRFQLYRYHKSNPSGLPFGEVNAFAEDKSGNIWIGTNGGGLIYFDRKKNTFRQYRHNPKDPNSLSTDVIVSLLVDHEGILWIGTYYGGLNRFDGKKFMRYRHDPLNSRSIGDDNIWEIVEDSNHNLWMGTLKAGVTVYNRSKNEFFHYRSGDVNSIHTMYVASLMEDRSGNMWIGTGYGLEILQKASGRFVHYLNDPRNPETISNNGILALYEDSRGLVWIGTHGGLNLYNKEKNTFRSFQERDGLQHNFILTLTEDEDHNIWFSTPKGLTKIVVTGQPGAYSFSFKNFDQSDGLQTGAFHENAALKCASGELVFGGSNGFNIFQPKQLSMNSSNPKVLFTDFQIFNRSVAIGEKVNNNIVLSESISRTHHITLKPANNVFSIEFTALNFFHAEKSEYRYKLEGFSKEWLTTGPNERKVTFTNLDPGDYTLKVIASNSEGKWNETPAVLKITILPPFWKTKTALVLYAMFIIGGLLFIRWLTLTKERINSKIRFERIEAQRMHELDLMKIKFFTNISHEFRTPLTLILAPVEKLLNQENDPEHTKQFQMIYRNARRLLNLVNQLLDFRKMEVQDIRLNASEGNIVGYIKDLVYSFSDLSEKKHITLSFNSQIPQLESFFDRDKVEKIVFNLLSNAFKFTPENGRVDVALAVKNFDRGDFIEIKVSDSGIGIPADTLDRIFDRFFQHEIPTSMVNQGSGIGLSITQEFVKVHGGFIEVESIEGKGSTFRIYLPLVPLVHPSDIKSTEGVHDDEAEHEDAEDLTAESRPSLLLVEDNEDFRYYLKDNLKSTYQIIEAANGLQALEKANSHIPDLIVSDIMMPEMDGIEFCRKVKNDPNTSHIPVILLTARAAEEQKMEGFKSGADDYITKPFNFEILQARIRNLIQQREAIQKHFPKLLEVKASDIQVTTHDEKLIKSAIEIVENNLTNKDFSVEELSRQLGMSRVLLYKKLLALTGKTPIEFIRSIRMQRAAQLLEKSQYTVSEIAYQVGINNPKYFAKYFKEEYNMLPSNYAAEKRSKKT
jgi:signal transduction histidine kinase/ligand-binding sensor domain-containing protein/DNA-binding response OmpR family regulator